MYGNCKKLIKGMEKTNIVCNVLYKVSNVKSDLHLRGKTHSTLGRN